jgi:hypothetical protein
MGRHFKSALAGLTNPLQEIEISLEGVVLPDILLKSGETAWYCAKEKMEKKTPTDRSVKFFMMKWSLNQIDYAA